MYSLSFIASKFHEINRLLVLYIFTLNKCIIYFRSSRLKNYNLYKLEGAHKIIGATKHVTSAFFMESSSLRLENLEIMKKSYVSTI
jgi:hypothetical protein